MTSGFLRLNWNDFFKGAVVSIGAVLFTYLAGAMNAPGFDLSSFDWPYIIKLVLSTFVGYTTKNLFTDSEGKFLGKV
jgi:hypothetical protein